MIAEEIQCKSKLLLLLKHDQIPVCVTSQTAAKLADQTLRKGWTPSNHLWNKLGQQLYSISDPSSCPRICIATDSANTIEEAEKMTNLRVELPKYLPKDYDFYRFFAQDNSLSLQILPKPLPQKATWGEFYLLDGGIFITFYDFPNTIDGKAQIEYWAKSQKAQNISSEGNQPIFIKERTITFDENLNLLFLGVPSEAEFTIDNISVKIVGYVSPSEIISIANSFF